MAKIKLRVSATIEDTFKDFIVSRKAKGLAEKTVQSYWGQFYAVARHLDVKMDIALLQKADLEAMIFSLRKMAAIGTLYNAEPLGANPLPAMVNHTSTIEHTVVKGL